MHAEVLRAQQPLLFRRDGSKVNIVRRALGGLRKGPREFQQNSAAGAVIRRAVVDVVALRVGIDTEMIVVRSVQNSVAARRRSAYAAHYIRAHVAAHAALYVGTQSDWKFKGMEAAFSSHIDRLIEIA